MTYATVPLRRILKKLNRPVLSDDGVVTAYRSGLVTLRSKQRAEGYTLSDKEQGYQGVEPGDFVFHALDGFAGAVGMSDSRGKCTPVYHVCSAPLGDDLRYVRWALRSAADTGYLETMAPTTRQRSVDFRNWESFGRLAIPRPDVATQQRIADFLDEQIARLDDAANQLRSSRVLLAERADRRKRHILTGGDNFPPTQVPHPLVAARYVCRITTGSGDTQDAADDGPVPFYVRSDIPLTAMTATFDTEAVLTSGDGAGVGKIFHHVTGRFHAHQRVYVLHGFRGVTPRYFFHYFSTFFKEMALDGSAKSTVDSVRRDMISAMPFVLPPVEEQAAIVSSLDALAASTREALDAISLALSLIEERKRALITACVTGEFDVTTARARAADASLQGVTR